MSRTAASPAARSRPLGSLLFAVWMFGLAIVLGLVCLPLLLGPRRWVMVIVRLWVRWVLGALKLLCGISIEVRGREHLPSGACLIAAKHQSMLDTLAPFLFLPDPCISLKKELLRIPIFGWYAAKVEMVRIDREGGAKTMRELLHRTRDVLADGRQFIIYPEGTRQAPGAPPDYKPGVAGLYRDLRLACLPMATNAGLVWPAHGLTKYPGVAVFEILPAIPPGLKRSAFMQELEARIETASAALLPES